MALKTDTLPEKKGLSSAEASARLLKYGENVLEGRRNESAAKMLTSQFKDALTLILIASTAISVLMGEYVEAATILAIVLLNALLGFLQEYRTERTLEALQALSAPTAKVLRDGKLREIPASQVVPGDVVLLSAGCRVPADGRLLEAFALSADESLLTGESVPIGKEVMAGEPGFLYMGTTVASGHGRALVTGTGMHTRMGGIAGLLKETVQEQTPLQRRLTRLSVWIGAGCLAVCGIVTLTGVLRGESPFNMFLTGLSLAVAAVPEGLTAVITISLGLAVSRMLKKSALIRRLHAVEALGCADIICSDKTGTLTQNKMTVRRAVSLAGPADGCPAVWEKMKLAAVLCNNAADDSSASPTELAVLEMAKVSGANVGAILSCYAREAEIPFDSSRKRMSVSVLSRSGERFVFTKGAPDVLMRCCSSCMMGDRIVSFGPSERERAEKLLSGMASEALRVIAFAYKPCSGGPISESGLIFIGMAGLADPPRPEARPAVLKCRSAGIRTVMITGDHRDTAVAVAREIGIPADTGSVMTGAEIDALSDRRFAEKADGIRVFARVTPAHKMRIVRALKASGHTVAMTGDGVNDAPAVRAADIGVSMGKGGTDVTREASGIVLLDDNFATLVSAVEEGRIIYENIRKFIRYLLSCNIGEVFTMFAGMLIGLPVVLLPIQILMVNLVTDGLPAIALGFDPPQSDPMALPPRPRNESVFSRGLGFTIVTRGLLIGLSVLLAFTSVLRSGEGLAAARTCAFASLVLTQLVHSFECKSESRSLFTIRLLNNWKLIGASLVSLSIVLACIYVPALAEIFGTVPLGWGDLGKVLLYSGAVPLVSAVLMLMRQGK
ncbi:MAG TPA: cation-translocating P-type ATPase [Oscillospiraceae bacterium]|nr:cation-translocating P-type ATPase [Oscillospiraceae bacterium]